MNCPKCNRENDNGAMFCRYCGAPMCPNKNSEDSNLSSVLIFVWVLLIGVFSVSRWVYTTYVDEWYTEARLGYVILSILQDLSILLPVFAIKNLSLKVVGMVVTFMLLVWWIVLDVKFFFQ